MLPVGCQPDLSEPPNDLSLRSQAQMTKILAFGKNKKHCLPSFFT